MRRIQAWLGTGRGGLVGLVVTFALLALAVVFGWLASLDTSVGGPGIVGLELVGDPDAAAFWVSLYGTDDVFRALAFDVPFILCWAPLLALVALWTGPAYRTMSTRRLGVPLALVALGAGALDLLEDLFVLLGCGPGGLDPWATAWQLAAAASWAKWLAILVVGLYAAGGLLSLLLRGEVRAVLRQADTATGGPARFTEDEGGLGLAFSGGGIRAASISLGALQSLERDGLVPRGWDQADHVTSVSGGSYMTGAWSVARSLPRPASPDPEPWAYGGVQITPEERHLRANLGYLLSNTPRGSGEDAMTTGGSMAGDAVDATRARRLPAVIATVLTGIAVNALVFLGVLWVVSQLVGWFYRWYVGLTCPSWRLERALTFQADRDCLVQPGRVGWPILVWLAVGVVAVVLWVAAGKFSDASGRTVPPAWLLVPKFLGYGGLAVAALLAAALVVVPMLIELLWRPVAAHDLFTSVVTVAGALGSAGAVFRILRKPLARFAPVLGGVVFGALLLFLVCRWGLGAMAAAPADRHLVLLVVVVVVLLALHLLGTSEFWSLAAFYRGKLRSAFATYRLLGSDGVVRARAYVNNDTATGDERVEPALAALPVRSAAEPTGTPLTICASATVTGRGVRTHYGVPALSVTFSPTAVRLFVPQEEDGLWQRYECSAADLGTLRPSWSPRLTTMRAVGLSGAAVSPAMGRFRLGPVSMLLAFANVRLGSWIPNPRWAAELAALGSPLPRPGLGYLLKEFLGFHDPSDLYLYVTDGGHWENTALVELLRTAHHRELICVDADSGPGNLARSISRAVDLAQLECAASIALNLDVLRADPEPSPGRDYSPRSVNIGLVRRVDQGIERISVLWYCKPALTQDMPPQLLAYREVDPTFPRISTVNQFFHTAQFAAYRDLGRYNARKILAARSTLAAVVGGCATFVAFRGAVQAGVTPEPPEAWVLPELLSLIEQLVLARVPDEQAAYAEELYATVAAALA
ncbi:hypothetical protein ACT8ZV_00425 [Nocardioides sp. MAHUQ-72]|uniref:hypothetical protein n=1 Tax=unclassified Nocardioides TaxID=2615069 RepID=UPI003618308F